MPLNFSSRLKLEPTAVLSIAEAAIYLAVAFGLPLTNDQTGTMIALVAAVVAVAGALAVRPFQWPLLKGVAQAAIACAGAFGAGLTASQQGALLTVTAVTLGALTRQRVTPETKRPPITAQISAPMPAGTAGQVE